MVKIVHKMIYLISILSFIVLTILTKEMLPLIYQANWQGIIYLVSVILMLSFELFMLFFNKKVLKECLGYNLFIIMITMYVGIIYYKIFSIHFNSFLYNIDLTYCKENYLFLGISLVFLLVNILWVLETKKKEIL